MILAVFLQKSQKNNKNTKKAQKNEARQWGTGSRLAGRGPGDPWGGQSGPLGGPGDPWGANRGPWGALGTPIGAQSEEVGPMGGSQSTKIGFESTRPD